MLNFLYTSQAKQTESNTISVTRSVQSFLICLRISGLEYPPRLRELQKFPFLAKRSNKFAKILADLAISLLLICLFSLRERRRRRRMLQIMITNFPFAGHHLNRWEIGWSRYLHKQAQWNNSNCFLYSSLISLFMVYGYALSKTLFS